MSLRLDSSLLVLSDLSHVSLVRQIRFVLSGLSAQPGSLDVLSLAQSPDTSGSSRTDDGCRSALQPSHRGYHVSSARSGACTVQPAAPAQ